MPIGMVFRKMALAGLPWKGRAAQPFKVSVRQDGFIKVADRDAAGHQARQCSASRTCQEGGHHFVEREVESKKHTSLYGRIGSKRVACMGGGRDLMMISCIDALPISQDKDFILLAIS